MVQAEAFNNLVLIGMPGAGKTTVGKALAADLAWGFCDTDHLLEAHHHCDLQTLLDRHGYLKLREMEGEIVVSRTFSNTIISTGGSMVYSERGMSHLKSQARCVYLYATASVLLERIGDFSNRGLAAMPGQGFEQLFQERHPYYVKYADLVIDVDSLTVDELVNELAAYIH